MYESYWQLARSPFGGNLDADLYYPSESHQSALLKIRYSIENHRGAALLCGASGTGKTLLVELLRHNLAEQFAPVIHVVVPVMSGPELLAYVADGLGVWGGPSGRASVEENIRRIETTLAENGRAGKQAVLVVDEAHLLADTEVLESLRLLTNIQGPSGAALFLLVVGQAALLPAIGRMPHFEERFGVKSLLRPLTADETAAYANHRMSQAGATRQIFEDDALDAIYELTQGIPRRINRLGDLALVVGYADEQQSITRSHIESVAGELELQIAA